MNQKIGWRCVICASISLLFSACQTTYRVTLAPPKKQSPPVAEAQKTLDAFLLARGYHRGKYPDWYLKTHPDDIAFWRKDIMQDFWARFWWGPGHVTVTHASAKNYVLVFVDQNQGKPGMDRVAVQEVSEMLKNRFPDCCVKSDSKQWINFTK